VEVEDEEEVALHAVPFVFSTWCAVCGLGFMNPKPQTMTKP